MSSDEKESTPEEIKEKKENEENKENKENKEKEESYEILREDFPNYDLSFKVIVIGDSGNSKNFIYNIK